MIPRYGFKQAKQKEIELLMRIEQLEAENAKHRGAIKHFLLVSNDPDLHTDDDERYQKAHDALSEIIEGLPPRVDGSGYVLKDDYWKLIEENAALKEQVRWRKCSEELPDSGVPVLVRYKNGYGKTRTVRACWIPKYFDEVGDFDDESWFDYDDSSDSYYSPQGWYEVVDEGESLMYQMNSDHDYTWLPIPKEVPVGRG